jgi:GTP-binding protein
MNINDVKFIGSFSAEPQCPKSPLPEYAFIGRSNVGKSSLINMLAGRKEIARVSKLPGKTQLLNFFLIDESWHLVDLPGYGYAKISKSKRLEWEKMIDRYLVTRQNLQCAFVLIDSRHPLQQIDLDFINSLGERHIPFVLVYTKTDKLPKTKLPQHINRIKNDLLKHWNYLPQQFVTSAETGFGREELLSYIEELNAEMQED